METVVGARFAPAVLPYLYFFEMSNNWNFFAPNPEPPIYIEYELLDGQGQAIANGRWPDAKEDFFWRDRNLRRVTAADFMVHQEMSAEKMMVPYYCQSSWHPRSLRLWRVSDNMPTPGEVVAGKRRVGDGVGSERKFVSHTFCDGQEGGAIPVAAQ